MSLKEQIKEYIKNKEVVNIKEIYAKFPDTKKPNIRAVINTCVKRGDGILRSERGMYKYKK